MRAQRKKAKWHVSTESIYVFGREERLQAAYEITLPTEKTLLSAKKEKEDVQFEIGENDELKQSAVDNAIEEMVFSGGSLNLKLLGGSSTDLSSAAENRILPSRPQ